MTFRAKGYALTCCSVTALAVAVVEDHGDVMPGSAIRNAPLPPGQIVGLAAVTILGRVVPVPLPGPRAAYRVVGAALGGAGVALTMWALRERGRHAAGRFDLERPESLVTSGPYALSRHPMYVGWWLIHLGTGLYRGSAWVLLSVPAATLAEHPAVLAEERRLVEAFGSDAENYLARIPRYLPRRVGSS